MLLSILENAFFERSLGGMIYRKGRWKMTHKGGWRRMSLNSSAITCPVPRTSRLPIVELDITGFTTAAGTGQPGPNK